MINIKTLLYFIAATFILIACNEKKIDEEPESELIKITKDQFVASNMVLGRVENRVFEDIVSCNGTVIPMANGIANVSVPFAGIVKAIHCNNGQYVNKGQILIEISGNELIDLQKDLAETAAMYSRVKSEYERIKSLYEDKVGSEKEMKMSESEYNSTRAKYNALRFKVSAIGLVPEKVESGDFYLSYTIKAPIQGYISMLEAKLGSYIEPSFELIEIIDPQKLQLKLAVFSNDIPKLRKGQEIRFKPTTGDTYYTAELNSVGLILNADSKAIDCYASITDNNFNCRVSNFFIESVIITKRDTILAVPADAVFKSGNKNFVFVVDNIEDSDYYFKKQELKIGRLQNGFVEIFEDKIEKEILISGGYNI